MVAEILSFVNLKNAFEKYLAVMLHTHFLFVACMSLYVVSLACLTEYRIQTCDQSSGTGDWNESRSREGHYLSLMEHKRANLPPAPTTRTNFTGLKS